MNAPVRFSLKVLFCAAVYVCGVVLAGMFLPAMGIAAPSIPNASPTRGLMYLALASVMLSAGIAPLVRQIRGGWLKRWLILAIFIYLSMGLNTAIEASIFTRFGGWVSFAAYSFTPVVLWALAAAYALGSREPAATREHSDARSTGRSVGNWVWRGLAAVAAFPVIYFAFGTPVGILVGDYYRREMFGLTLPSVQTIILVQFLRGSLFLIAALPILLTWTGSRLRFVLVFGLAHFVASGLFGMVQATWFSGFIRVVHTTELLADSIAYSIALAALLLVPRREYADG